MHDPGNVLGCDLHRRVGSAGGGSADQQWNRETGARHFAGDMHHFVERRRDQARKSDQVRLLFASGGENLLARHHDSQVCHLVVIAGQHHADDVLADVVDVALDGGQQNAAFAGIPSGIASGVAFGTGGSPLRVHERRKKGDRFLHHAGGFYDLRKEHLAGAEQVADDAHSVHQRPLDDVERTRVFPPALLGIGVNVGIDAPDQGMGQPCLDGFCAPGEILLELGF